MTSGELDASREKTWWAQITRNAHERPTDVAIRFLGESTTWMELHSRVDGLANWLFARGVRRGDRVALLMTNRPQFLETVYATTVLGAMIVPINFRLSASEVAFVLEDSGARIVATEAALLQQLSLSSPVAVLVVGESGVEGTHEYDRAVDGSAPARTEEVVRSSDPAAIMYTSGTTGNPKGAVLTQDNFSAVTEIVVGAWRMDAADVVLAATPLFHIGGFGTTTPCAALGATMVILPSVPFDPRAVLATIGDEKVTATFMVPAQWAALCGVDEAGDMATSLRVLSWGAAPATTALLRRMAAVFPTASIVALFGQTEMAPITCVLDGDDAIRKVGSVGRPARGVSVRVVDPQMRDVPTGETGEIVYRGPNLMSGYWRNDAATEAAFDGGWFHSGDLVRRDADGFVYVVDRAKDMIISGGENIYSAEVENVLAGHSGVADVAVIGRPDEEWGEAVVAVVVPVDPLDPPTLSDLVRHCRISMASFKKPRDLVILDELPRNATGKVVKNDLRAKLALPK